MRRVCVCHLKDDASHQSHHFFTCLRYVWVHVLHLLASIVLYRNGTHRCTMSSHPFDAHSHSHPHDRLKRVYILPQDPGPQPYYFKPLMVPFEWRHLPSLPAILDPFLAGVVNDYVRKTCKPDVMELAFDGDGFLHHALTQAIRAACPSRSLTEVNVSDSTLTLHSQLCLCRLRQKVE